MRRCPYGIPHEEYTSNLIGHCFIYNVFMLKSGTFVALNAYKLKGKETLIGEELNSQQQVLSIREVCLRYGQYVLF